MTKGKAKRGSARMLERGLIPIQIWVSPNEYALIRAAAKRRERWAAIATWVRKAALAAAARPS